MTRIVLKKFRSLFELILERLTLKSPKTIFLLLFNFLLIYRQIPDRLSYVHDLKAFCLKGLVEQRFFTTRPQNYSSFKEGLRNRNLNLFNDYLINNLTIEPNDLVVDCGANIGDFYFALNTAFRGFKYIAFEPSIEEFRMLKLNIGSKGECHNVGLWNKNEKLNFYVSNENADSSFVKPIAHTHIDSIHGERLDYFVNGKIKLLKLEAEGSELQVLQGLGYLIDNCEYISADLGFENLGKSTLPEVTNYLLDKKFRIIDFGSPRIVVLFKNSISV